MKRAIAILAVVSGISMSALAAEFGGYVIDESCASKPAMKGNEACARKCHDSQNLCSLQCVAEENICEVKCKAE